MIASQSGVVEDDCLSRVSRSGRSQKNPAIADRTQIHELCQLGAHAREFKRGRKSKWPAAYPWPPQMSFIIQINISLPLTFNKYSIN